MARLSAEARSNAEKMWLEYLELEVMLGRNEHAKALAKIKVLEAKNKLPDSFIRTRLFANIYAGLGDRGKTEDYETRISELNRKSGYYSSIDGLTSPIGSFSLMPR